MGIQSVLVLAHSGVHDDAPLLGLIAVPKVNHEYKAVVIDQAE